jgi:MAF protein
MMEPSSPPPNYDRAVAEHAESRPLLADPAAATPAGPPPKRQSMLRRPPPPLDLPIIKHLNTKRVVLASASPRRRALLAQVGLTSPEIIPSTKPENLDKTVYGPEDYVAATARQKCLDVYETQMQRSSEDASVAEPDVVIAADTIIVTRAGQVLEKPRSEDEHLRMLRHLRDTVSHKVLTAVCVMAPRADARSPGYVIATGVEVTTVYFAQDGRSAEEQEEEGKALDDDVIAAYVRTREGADKAGGYAVQGMGGLLLVERLEGSVDNVIGLPVRKTLALAEKVVFRQEDEDEEEEGEGEGEGAGGQ